MTVALHRQFYGPTPSLADPTVADVLRALDERADDVSRAAARIIRAKEIELLSLDAEIVDAEWRAMAHAVEIETMREAFKAREQRMLLKVARR